MLYSHSWFVTLRFWEFLLPYLTFPLRLTNQAKEFWSFLHTILVMSKLYQEWKPIPLNCHHPFDHQSHDYDYNDYHDSQTTTTTVGNVELKFIKFKPILWINQTTKLWWKPQWKTKIKPTVLECCAKLTPFQAKFLDSKLPTITFNSVRQKLIFRIILGQTTPSQSRDNAKTKFIHIIVSIKFNHRENTLSNI